MMKKYLNKIIEKENLTLDESYDVMLRIMSGDINNILLSAFLVALKSKGETAEEIAGFVKAMREKSLKIKADDAIDVCGTGGDSSGTFNISTAAAFVAAGAGVKVAKHGNRSVSSSSGSADVLKELGVNIEMKPELAEESLNKIGITFLFAPLYHPAMRFASETRKELGIRTVFNIIGPLTNPATVRRQMVGTFNNNTAKLLCNASVSLDYDKIKIICNADKYDEILMNETTKIFEYNSSIGHSEYVLTNKDFNYPEVDTKHLLSSSTKESAKMILDLLQNLSTNGTFHTVTANAAVALNCSGYSDSLDDCISAAEESIRSGAAFNKLKELAEFSNK
jgi:anthranilate phosphoribosyltransferase